MHPQINSLVKLIKLETGYKEYKKFLGHTGIVTKCDRYGDRRFYWVKFDYPASDILFVYRPEIEVVERKENDRPDE